MSRISVVTGAASGIGQALAELLRSRGERVIGVDLHDADVIADLSTEEGLAGMVDAVRQASGGVVDAVFAIAGLVADKPVTVDVNFFGMVGTLNGLRPLLAQSTAPRAVGTASIASLQATDDGLVAAMTSGDRATARSRAAEVAGDGLIYGSTKKAFAQWIRRTAPTADWAGTSIPLNAVAPGVVNTPMVASVAATMSEEESRKSWEATPLPLNGVAEPIVLAEVFAWLGSPANTHMCGQVVFADSGYDAVVRGDSVW